MQQLLIGQLPVVGREALIPYLGDKAIVLTYEHASQQQALGLAENIALQLFAQHPAGQAQIVLYEAAPSREFAAIKYLFAATENKAGKQLVNLRECTTLLVNLTEQLHSRLALLLNAQMADMASYNAAASRPETITYLVIVGLGQLAQDAQQLQHLQHLCQQGAMAGIVPILLHDRTSETADGLAEFRRQALQHFWQGVTAHGFGFTISTDALQSLGQPTELWRLFHKFGIQVGVDETTRRDWVDTFIASRQANSQTFTHTDFLHIPIGKTGVQPTYFSLGEKSDTYHVLMGGATRTGKTTLLNNIILTACETFTPEELQLALFDFKEGISFNIYAGLGHIHTLHLDNDDKAYAIGAFERFEVEIRERTRTFREFGQQNKLIIQTLPQYNRVASTPMPRLLVIVDEAQSLFEDRETKQAAKRMLRTLSRKGAAFGLHLILCTQSYQNVELDGDVKEQFRLRIALQLASSMACRALMGRDNDAPLSLPRYTAIYNNNYGELQDNRLVALDGLDDAELYERIAALKARYPAQAQPEPEVVESEPTPSPVKPKPSICSALDEDWG
jgi:hypothetical protein